MIDSLPEDAVFSTQISRASAALLLIGGLVLLFASDEVLPRLISGFPAAGTWLGQLLAAAWLAVSALNWFNRRLLLGGIYGRPVVFTNAVLYLVGAMVLLNGVARSPSTKGVWLLVVPFVVFAAVYGWLLFRGPLDHDLEMQRRSQQRPR
jgi:hypothetical protein